MTGLAPRALEDRAIFGIGLALLAYSMFSITDASAKWLAVLGYPALQIAFMRYFTHFLISSAQISHRGWSWQYFRTQQLGLVVLRGALLLNGTVLNFFALKYLPLTLTATIFFSAPIIVCLLSGPMLGEVVGKWRWSAILLGFIGVLIAIRPFGESFHWAVFLSLGSVTCFAFYLLLTRRLAGLVASDTLQLYTGLIGTSVLLPFAIYTWQPPESLQHWLLLFGLGAAAWFGHELLTRAYCYADANTLTPYSYSFMIYLTLWSIVLFDHYPDHWTLIGATIIVCSGLIIWLRERHRSQMALTCSSS
jgi:drug/metabolite transporter (DMT)-like permease